MSIISARNLCKRYGRQTALEDFSFELEPGRILGIIGPNGSGKSTALKSLMGLVHLDSGELDVLGLNPYAQRATLMQHTRYIADVGILPRWMRVDQLLAHIDAIDGNFDKDAALNTLAGTSIGLRKRIRSLSRGMMVQLHLALVLATRAPLLILDEPTLGLDILYRQRFYESLLGEYFDDDRAIVITTHEISEVEHLLTDVVLISNGRARLSSPIEALPERFVKVTAGAQARAALEASSPLWLRATLDGLEAIFETPDAQQLAPLGSLSTPSLSELFIAVMEATP